MDIEAYRAANVHDPECYREIWMPVVNNNPIIRSSCTEIFVGRRYTYELQDCKEAGNGLSAQKRPCACSLSWIAKMINYFRVLY